LPISFTQSRTFMPLYGLSCIAACFGTGAYLEPPIVRMR
jgi:hypothetical protein